MLFLFAWLRRRRRRKLQAVPFPAAWREHLLPCYFYEHLDTDERARLEDILRVIVSEANWEGGGDFEVTERVQVIVAGLAALLVLNIEHDYFRGVTSILIYPSTYRSTAVGSRDGMGNDHGTAVLGEAWYRGPVVLSWDSVEQGALNPEDGQNVVLHEFAHRLDMLDGFTDGTPPLRHRSAYKSWQTIMTKEFERLKAGNARVLDRYGATNEAEFFAVATETFFEKPRQMKKRHGELYDLLKDYYQQDPLARLLRSDPTSE